MIELTTAAFAKADMAAMTEPVSIRRYTKVIGVFYPTGTGDGQTLVSDVDRDATIAAQAAEIERLTLDIKHLKHDLTEARKPAQVAPTVEAAPDDLSDIGFPPKA